MDPSIKRKGCSILFVDETNRLLLFLRDDIQGLPYANMWDIPGGHVEDGESPEQCIVREMKEEIGIRLDRFILFNIYDFNDRIEYVYLSSQSLNIDQLVLTEGQALGWFSREDIEKTELAYGFNRVANDYYLECERNNRRF